MAELFSVIASVASLLDIALRSSKALHSLQSQLKNAPDLIRALSNETEDIGAVLARLDDTRQASEAAGLGTPDSAAVLVDLEVQLRNAKAILTDLDHLTQKLTGETSRLKRVPRPQDVRKVSPRSKEKPNGGKRTTKFIEATLKDRGRTVIASSFVSSTTSPLRQVRWQESA